MISPRSLTAATLASVLWVWAAAAQAPLPKAGDSFAHQSGRVISLRTTRGTLEHDGLLSKDGRHVFGVLSKDKPAHLVVYDLQTNKEVRRFGEVRRMEHGYRFAVTRDETIVAAALEKGDTIALYDVETANQLRAVTIPPGQVAGAQSFSGLAFSPDGRTLYAATDRGQVVAWVVATGAVRWRADPPAGPHPTSVAPAGDGKLVAAGVGGYLRVLDAADGSEGMKLDVPNVPLAGSVTTRLRSLQVTPDGRAAVCCDTKRGIWAVDLDTGDVRQVKKLGANQYVEQMVLPPTGRFLLFTYRGETARRFQLEPLDGKPVPAPGFAGIPDIIAASQSGDRILVRIPAGLAQYCLPKR